MEDLIAFMIFIGIIIFFFMGIMILWTKRFDLNLDIRGTNNYEVGDEVVLLLKIENEIIPENTSGEVISKFVTTYGSVNLKVKFDGYDNSIRIDNLTVEAIKKINSKQKNNP